MKDSKSMTEYQVANTMHMFAFVSLIGPFIPFTQFVVPAAAIYSVSFWATYFSADHCDYQVLFKYLVHAGTIISAAYVIQYTVLRAYMKKNEYKIVLSILE